MLNLASTDRSVCLEEPQAVALRGFIPVDAVEARPVPREVWRVCVRAPWNVKRVHFASIVSGLPIAFVTVLGLIVACTVSVTGTHVVVEDVGAHGSARRASHSGQVPSFVPYSWARSPLDKLSPRSYRSMP